MSRHVARKRYESAHWGYPSTRAIHVKEPDYPAALTRMGVLLEIEVETDEGDHFAITFPARGSSLAFTPRSPESLWIVLSEAQKRLNLKELWLPDEPTYALRTIARHAPGRWATSRHYPTGVRAQSLGWAAKVMYATHKKGDPPANYVHELGEDTGKRPLLAIDEHGRLFFVGGNYTVPDEGITD